MRTFHAISPWFLACIVIHVISQQLLMIDFVFVRTPWSVPEKSCWPLLMLLSLCAGHESVAEKLLLAFIDAFVFERKP